MVLYLSQCGQEQQRAAPGVYGGTTCRIRGHDESRYGDLETDLDGTDAPRYGCSYSHAGGYVESLAIHGRVDSIDFLIRRGVLGQARIGFVYGGHGNEEAICDAKEIGEALISHTAEEVIPGHSQAAAAYEGDYHAKWPVACIRIGYDGAHIYDEKCENT